MKKNIVRWLMNIAFYVIYFLIYDYIFGRKLPANLMWNLFSLFVLTVINIPLSVVSTAKVFSIIENGEKN
ncbi:MAG: hypothetical protein GX214_08120 [Clostridiales bacterium]|nr:hypothetical protein [Clostridiales bacterium]